MPLQNLYVIYYISGNAQPGICNITKSISTIPCVHLVNQNPVCQEQVQQPMKNRLLAN